MNPTDKIDIISKIPVEISDKIFLYLEVTATINFPKVSRIWKNCLNNYSWRKKCEINLIGEPEKYYRSKECEVFLFKFNSYYEGLYSYHAEVFRNWLENSWEKIIVKPEFIHFPLINLIDQRVIVVETEFSRNVPRRFNVYNVKGTLIDSFSSRDNIFKIIRLKNYLIFRTRISNITVRNMETGSILWINSFYAVRGRNPCVFDADDDIVVATVENDATISVIDFNTGYIKFDFTHFQSIEYLKLNNKRIVTISNNTSINVWNINNHSLDLVYSTSIAPRWMLNPEHTKIKDEYLMCFTIHDHRIGIIVIWDLNKQKLIREVQIKGRFNTSNFKLIYRDSFDYYKVMDYRTGENLFNIETKFYVKKFEINSKFIIFLTPQDIRLYDLLTGKLKKTIPFDKIHGDNLPRPISITAMDTFLIYEWCGRENKNEWGILNFDVNCECVENTTIHNTTLTD